MVNKQSTKHLNDLTNHSNRCIKFLSKRIGKLFKQMNKLTDE